MEARSLAGPVVDIDVAPGTELVREGSVIGTFFLVRSGTAQLLVDGHPVGTLGVDDWFGESDPHSRAPQRHTVVAMSRMRVTTFSAFGISRLCDAVPGARKQILETAGAALAAG
jgi:CRP-like cAMP-binding protein